MKIRKKFQGTLPENKILNIESTSQTDTYSCEYINNLTPEVDNVDELPIGTVVKYNGAEVPDGWEEVVEEPREIYIASETVIGTWLGKPLYRMVIKSETTVIPNEFNTGVTNIDDLVTSRFQVKQSTSKDACWRPIPWIYNINRNDEYGEATWAGGWYLNGDTGVLYTQVGSNLSSIQKYIIVLEYTKTTD